MAEQRRRLALVTGAQVEADLATTDGVDRLLAATNGRAIDALLASAGRGLGAARFSIKNSSAHRAIVAPTASAAGKYRDRN